MPSITELVIRIAECEVRLAATVNREEEAEATMRARLHPAAGQIDSADPDWADWQALACQRRELEETLSGLLLSVRDTAAQTQSDVMSEIEFLARLSDDMTTGDDEDVIVPRWLLRKLRQDAQRLF